MTDEFYAQEAERLKKDTTLIEALARLRNKAITDLIQADVEKPIEVLSCQTMVKTCDNFLQELESMIITISTKSRTSIA